MTLALRRTVLLDGKRRPDDYEVRYNGRTIGRILRLRSTGRELWHWTQIDIRAPSYGPNDGVTDTFEEAPRFAGPGTPTAHLKARVAALPGRTRSLNTGSLRHMESGPNPRPRSERRGRPGGRSAPGRKKQTKNARPGCFC